MKVHFKYKPDNDEGVNVCSAQCVIPDSHDYEEIFKAIKLIVCPEEKWKERYSIFIFDIKVAVDGKLRPIGEFLKTQ